MRSSDSGAGSVPGTHGTRNTEQDGVEINGGTTQKWGHCLTLQERPRLQTGSMTPCVCAPAWTGQQGQGRGGTARNRPLRAPTPRPRAAPWRARPPLHNARPPRPQSSTLRASHPLRPAPPSTSGSVSASAASAAASARHSRRSCNCRFLSSVYKGRAERESGRVAETTLNARVCRVSSCFPAAAAQ